VNEKRQLTDADRTSAAARLREAFTSGVLTHDDFNSRLDIAFAADSIEILERITRDLPDIESSEPPQHLRLAVSHGNVERMGAWSIPDSIELTVRHATATLDFRESAIPEHGVQIALQSDHSRVVLLVRSHATLDYQNLGRHRSRISDRTHAAVYAPGALRSIKG
jgi:hypothetical protein